MSNLQIVQSMPAPQILSLESVSSFPLDDSERKMLSTANRLLTQEFYPQALVEIWNASIRNIRRRIENYGVDLFIAVEVEEGNKSKFSPKGDTLSARWEGVDFSNLLAGAKNLGLISTKSAKTLETINWMRNHASSAHESDEEVGQMEVLSFAMILEQNLFSIPLPDPGHSVGGLFGPIKSKAFDAEELSVLTDQIKSFNQRDVRTCFGFLLDLLSQGSEPGLANSHSLLPICWAMAPDDLKKVAGFKYHNYDLDKDADSSSDKGAKTRLLEFLVSVDGIKFIPDGAKAKIYRRLAKQLAEAKNSDYGFAKEEAVSQTIKQFGPNVPRAAFEEFYQEVLSVWIGNYWRRSAAHLDLQDFISSLNTESLMIVVEMFVNNSRVREELFQVKPKAQALKILGEIDAKLTFAAHKLRVAAVAQLVQAL